jgi:hypothetical protein
MGNAEVERPHWDSKQRKLWLDNTLVKQFTTPAPIQELILAWFEKNGWDTPIRVPLFPGRSKRSQQDRLHDAVVSLNRHQLEGRVYFYRNGNGKVGWELTPTHTRKGRPRPLFGKESE